MTFVRALQGKGRDSLLIVEREASWEEGLGEGRGRPTGRKRLEEKQTRRGQRGSQVVPLATEDPGLYPQPDRVSLAVAWGAVVWMKVVGLQLNIHSLS